LYEVNPPKAQGGAASMKMDFSHADAADPSLLNRILWRDVRGDIPMPAPRHTVIPQRPGTPKDDD